MVCKNTLKIKNLPKELTDAQKEDFARHFGASTIKVITSHSTGRSIVFAKFENNEVATAVMHRLHQTRVLNNIISVEYAPNDLLAGKQPSRPSEEPEVVTETKFYETFIKRINAFNDYVGFHQPPPPHLKYEYPKANRATVSNIAHALATVPKFYTQVLHLMNKMNLPPPFATVEQSAVPHQPSVPVSTQNPPTPKPSKNKSSSESELESDEDNKQTDIIPEKRVLPQKKVVKRPKFIKPQVNSIPSSSKPSEKPENVFEKSDVILDRKIELKVNADSLDNKQEQETRKTGSFGIMLPLVKPVEIEKVDKEETDKVEVKKKHITEDELLSNQIPLKDVGVLPVFKNYHPGTPTCRLYIKNIAKTVTQEDLEYIYSLYKLDETEDRPSQFDIRLMQEGRMKGQAFITLDTVEQAQKALEQTNAYILKDKPMVVVFAKSAPTPKNLKKD